MKWVFLRTWDMQQNPFYHLSLFPVKEWSKKKEKSKNIHFLLLLKCASFCHYFLFSIEKKYHIFFAFYTFQVCSDLELTVRYLKPRVEMAPATNPISMAPYGPMFMSAHVPTATPPAKVAFWMWTCGGLKGILMLRFPQVLNSRGAPLGVVYPTMSSFPLCSTKLETA